MAPKISHSTDTIIKHGNSKSTAGYVPRHVPAELQVLRVILMESMIYRLMPQEQLLGKARADDAKATLE